MDDEPLFGDTATDRPVDPGGTRFIGTAALRLADRYSSDDFWDETSIVTMADRQDAVSRAAGRHVASLRDLTSREALAVAEKLVDKNRTGATGSRWDQRDEDTWIDSF